MAEREYIDDDGVYRSINDDPYTYGLTPPDESRPKTPQELADELRNAPGYVNPNAPPASTTPPPPPPASGRGTMDPNAPPSDPPPAGTKWTFDPANGWYPRAVDIPTGGQTTGGGNTTSGIDFGAIGGSSPTLNYPDYQSAGVFAPPNRTPLAPFKPRTATFELDPLTLDPYAPSSWSDAEQEPGYQPSRDQLKKQVEASAAYRGMARSGMTIRDLYTNLDALGQQNFKQFDDRRFRNYRSDVDTKTSAWAQNQAARFDKFGAEYGIDRDVYDRYANDIEAGNAYAYAAGRDVYDRHAQDVDRGNNYRYNVADAGFKDALSRWTTMVNSLTSVARPVE